MNLMQAQCLLKYLGYYTIGVDGIYGKASKQAIEDFQRDNDLPVDGLNGPQTDPVLIDAVAKGRFKKTKPESSEVYTEASKYLKPDGFYHIPRGVNVQLSKNLWSSEVMCQGRGCCSESIISKRMVDTYQKIRDRVGLPIEIGTAGGSGYRCPEHNADPTVGGAANSLHLTGSAFDMHCSDDKKLLSAAEEFITDGEIGIYSWGIHGAVWSRGYINRFYG